MLAATDPAQPYGAALSWPKRPEGRRPARTPGAYVLLRDGNPVVYVERGGKGIVRLVELEGERAGRGGLPARRGGAGEADPEARDRARRRRAGDRLGPGGADHRRRLLAPAAAARRRRVSVPEGDTIHRAARADQHGARRPRDRARRGAQPALAASPPGRRARRAHARGGRGTRQAPARPLLRRPRRAHPPRDERQGLRRRRRPTALRAAVAGRSRPAAPSPRRPAPSCCA